MSEVRQIEIKGTVYTLTNLNLNHFVEIEEKYGEKGFQEALATMKGTRCLLWMALRKHHPDLNEEKVGELIDMGNMDKIREIIGILGEESLPPDVSPPRKKGKASR